MTYNFQNDYEPEGWDERWEKYTDRVFDPPPDEYGEVFDGTDNFTPPNLLPGQSYPRTARTRNPLFGEFGSGEFGKRLNSSRGNL
jgi:hypothetical protein